MTSIGIEVCCHNDTANKTANSKDWYFDTATVDALVELTKALMAEYGIDADHVIRHYDVTHKICPAMWVHNETAWKAFKARLTGSAVTPNVPAIVRLGSQGDAVKTLQRALTKLRYYDGLIDGVFGSDTMKAVKAFQTSKGLVADGIVGPVTWKALLA
jgi:N-acetylmuramoyl-L-alanine amidase CwlA